MQTYSLLDYLPIWGIFCVTVIIVTLAFEIGFRLAGKQNKTQEGGFEGSVGSIVGATLGLLAFILAFTFSLAASRFDERRRLVLEESNAIGTTYLRAGYLSEPFPGAFRPLLRDYAAVRLEAIQPGKILGGLEKSSEIQNRLWSQAEQLAKKYPDLETVSLFIQSLNEVIDIHAERVLIGMRSRIPDTIWYALYFVTFLAIASMGYQMGLSKNRCLTVNFALILTFSAVMTLIADLDRPQEGSLKVSQQSMIDLYNKIKE